MNDSITSSLPKELLASLASYGMVSANLPEAMPKEKTIIVVGVQRGGTSMVAQLLHQLGVPLGDAPAPTYEDLEYTALLRAYDAACRRPLRGWLKRRRIEKDMLAIARKRDQQYPVWGWKFPDVLCPPLYRQLRNPFIISVHRDPVSICARLQRSEKLDFFTALPNILSIQGRIHRFLIRTDIPCLMLSYEKALLNPEQCVKHVAAFLGIDLPDSQIEQMAEAIRPSPKQYLRDTRQARIIGNLDSVEQGFAVGWAADTKNPEAALPIRIIVDNTQTIEGTADQPRDDVRDHLSSRNIDAPDNHFGFRIPLPAELQDGELHHVFIEIPGHKDFQIDSSDTERMFTHPKETA